MFTFELKGRSVKSALNAKFPLLYLHMLPQLCVIHVSRFLFSILQEPVRSLGPRIPSSDMLDIFLTLPLPGISLLHVCAKPMSPPQKVRLLQHLSKFY